MKKILLSSAALMALTAAASAADLPRRTVAPAPAFVAAPVFTWTGFYVGGNVGWGFANNDNDTVTFPATAFPGLGVAGGTVTVDRGHNDGILGGAQVGYNMQFGGFVVGVEADIQAADLRNDRGTFVAVGTFPAGFAVANVGREGVDWFGTVRGRAGFAFDRFLVYGTAGFAFGGVSNNNGCVATTFGGTVCGNGDDTRSGWAAGGGVEYAWTNNMTVGVEGLWVDLGHDTAVVRATDNLGRVFATTVREKEDFGLVRAKLNFKF